MDLPVGAELVLCPLLHPKFCALISLQAGSEHLPCVFLGCWRAWW